MFRRNALLSLVVASTFPITSAATTPAPADADRVEKTRLKKLAQDLADLEFAAFRRAVDDWQTASYLHDINLDAEYSAFYLVTSDTRLLDRWAARVERAMFPGNLRVYAFGKSGPIAGAEDGYNVVTLFVVGKEGLEQERRAFADLYAKHPAPTALTI